MTDDDESYKTDGGHPSWGVNPRIGKTPDAEANKIAEESYRNITRNPVPASTELIAMAKQEGELADYTLTMKLEIPAKMREEGIRKYIHSQIFHETWGEAFQTTYIHAKEFRVARSHSHNPGPLSEKKPNWRQEQIEAAKSGARKEMAKTVSEILDREWMCDLNEIKYIMDCVANGNTDPFKDRPGTGGNPP